METRGRPHSRVPKHPPLSAGALGQRPRRFATALSAETSWIASSGRSECICDLAGAPPAPVRWRDVRKSPARAATPRWAACRSGARQQQRNAVVSKITVFSFFTWDHRLGRSVLSPTKGTAKRIDLVGGKVVPGSGEDVEAATLDKEGRYRPAATTRPASPQGLGRTAPEAQLDLRKSVMLLRREHQSLLISGAHGYRAQSGVASATDTVKPAVTSFRWPAIVPDRFRGHSRFCPMGYRDGAGLPDSPRRLSDHSHSIISG